MNRGWLPPVGSGPGIWVTQPLTPTGEKTKKWRRGITRPVGVRAIKHSTKECSVHWRFRFSATVCESDGTISTTLAQVVDGVFVGA